MGQIVVQIPLAGLLTAAVVIAGVMICMMVRLSGEEKRRKKERTQPAVPVPFSEPRPYPEPDPPNLRPAQPVVPPANPLIRPVRYAYDQRFFERFYVPFDGQVEEVYVHINDTVKKGDILMRIRCGETMTDVTASAGGRVREINCRTGGDFRREDLLFVIQ